MKVAVIGAGTMGAGIAHVLAVGLHKVILVDVKKHILEKALGKIQINMDRQVKKGIISKQLKEDALNRISESTDLKTAVSQVDLVIEVIAEKEVLKLELFKLLDAYCPSHTILASNTSAISITKLAQVTSRPNQVIGMHFMNPVPMMKLVEVVKGRETSADTTNAVVSLAEQLGKIPVTVNDAPGFVANRILMPMINEAIHALKEGVAGVKEIDQVMMLGMFHPMGPLQLADFIGLDVCLFIMEVMHKERGDKKYAPCSLLLDMVEREHLGSKTKIGFYDWSKGGKDLSVASAFKQ